MRVALLLLLLTPAVALAQAGRFLLAAGEVTVIRGGKEARAAAGTTLEAGDTIRVGPRSSVQLRMSDQQIISLRANTEFRIDEYVHRGDEGDRSIFSLVKGGMRTVGGAIARQQSEAFLRASARPEAPAGPQPSAEERKPESERKAFDLIKAPLRTVAGALTPTRHAVRVPTATIGVRGTHYTVVHCDNDCAPNGTYGGISDGLIEVFNDRDTQQFGANSFFYVASAESLIQSLIGPPAFLYDRLEAQERGRGRPSAESSATMAQSGVNAESRPNVPVVQPGPSSFLVAEQRVASGTPRLDPPLPPTYVVVEQRADPGLPVVVFGDPGGSIQPPVVPPSPPVVPPAPPVAPNTAFLSAFTNAAGGPGTVAAFVDKSAVALQDIGDGIVLFTGFNVSAGSTANPATGAYSGSALTSVDDSVPNQLGAVWGRWFDGSVTDASGKTTVSAGTPLFHYLVGPNTPPEVVAAKRGTFAFDLVQGTLSATNNLGEAVLPGTSMTAIIDFDRRSATLDPMRLAFPTQTWDVQASNPSPINIDARGAFFQSTAAGSCTSAANSCNGPAQFTSNTVFMGPAADHLGHSFNGLAKSSGPNASVQGSALLTCKPSC